MPADSAGQHLEVFAMLCATNTMQRGPKRSSACRAEARTQGKGAWGIARKKNGINMKRKADATYSTWVRPWNKIVLKRNALEKAGITPHWQVSQKMISEVLHLQIQFVRGLRKTREGNRMK